MPRLMAMAKTVRQIRDGIEVLLVGDEFYPPARPDEVPRSEDGWGYENFKISDFDIVSGRLYKNVTRRDGWKFAKVGDVVQLIEWSPRVGSRWVCDRCGTVPACRFLATSGKGHKNDEDVTCGGYPEGVRYRKPQRLGLRRIAEVSRERLGDITPVEVIREGFPGMSPEDFVAKVYCAPGKPEPDREVTRLVLERVEETP